MNGQTLRALLALLLVLLLATASGCSYLQGLLPSPHDNIEELPPEEEDPDWPVSAAGATLTEMPDKVVSLSPALTEKLHDLGDWDRVAGVSSFCTYPQEVEALPDCGTALLPNLESIREIAPQLVLTETPLPEEDLIQLQQMGVEVAVLPHAKDLNSLYQSYRELSMLLHGRETGLARGQEATDDFQRRLDRLVLAAGKVNDEKLPVLYLRLLDYTVATGDTLESQLIQALGMENIASGYTGWIYPADAAISDAGRKEFEEVKMIFCDEDAVSIKDLEGSAFYKGLPAVLGDWYLYIDASIFEQQGFRMLDELERMLLQVYPEAEIHLLTAAPAADGDDDVSDPQPQEEADGDLLDQPEDDAAA